MLIMLRQTRIENTDILSSHVKYFMQVLFSRVIILIMHWPEIRHKAAAKYQVSSLSTIYLEPFILNHFIQVSHE